jgi:D-sedoheptulose 7-phosphate isomerase
VNDGTDAFVRSEMTTAADAARTMAEDPQLRAVVGAIADAIIRALQSGRKVLFAGNGGSAADAQHLAAELVGRFGYDRPAMAAIALTTDTSALTAIGNDYGYERVFSRQVEALTVEGDVLIGLSTSGRSPNVIRALEAARARGVVTIGFAGREGRDMTALCDLLLCVPADFSAHIQQGHMIAGHIVCGLVERAIHPRA